MDIDCGVYGFGFRCTAKELCRHERLCMCVWT